uniref:S8 family serine peptidase n=1 Tax=Parerythrobacter lutipelagi TaxID=1964208 RepID=UPI001F00F242|nr:S8 family serine peptidase [Parerythrobacter lutipelagi]
MWWRFARLVMPLVAAFALLPSGAMAQLGALPQVNLPPVGPTVGGALETTTREVGALDRRTQRLVDQLARERLRDIDRLVRRNADRIEQDTSGAPARRGELLAMALTDGQQATLERAGFRVLGTERIEDLSLSVTRLSTPEGLNLADAQAVVSSLAPDASITPDHLYFQAGAASATLAISMQGTASISTPVGVIDGGPSSAVPVTDRKGFANGAPMASNHGTAVAGLLREAGVRTIYAADVYGNDPAGGNALAIAKALGWTVGRGSKVVTISLVGPRNPVLEGAIRAAQRRGATVVAAVGNDGPAAPPAFPASYDGVIAVTAVDRRNRALIEAGRALHLDYAAPGADFHGLDARGKRIKLRGTSYAAPLVTARIAAHGAGNWRSKLDREARDLGAKGPDSTYGRGLVCERCVAR